MSQFRLRAQLLLLSLSLIVGFLLFGARAWRTIEQTKVGGPEYSRIVLYKDLVADILPPPNYIIESYLTVLQLADPERASAQEALIAKLAQLRQDYDDRHKFWLEQALPDAIKGKFLKDAHEPAEQFFVLAEKEFVPAVRAQQSAEIDVALTQLESLYEAHRKAVDAVVALSTREQTTVETGVGAALTRDLWLLLAVFVLSVAFAMAINAWFAGSLLQGISRARARLAAIAQGHLDNTPVAETRADEIGDLLRSLDLTAENLRRTVGDIRAAAETVSTSAEELSATIASVAESSANQSEAVCSVAATVEQMSSGVNEMAALSIQCKESGIGAGSRCDQGNTEISGTATVVEQLASDVQETAKSINALGERSREISSIVGVIREIADQTNLLALNAAIEAARAGEQGRGFAVVADEVRKLAERTAQSTDQISRMIVQIQDGIEHSVRGMSEGSERARASIDSVQTARQTMVGIAAETRALVGNIQEIAQGLEAQRQGSGEIAGVIERIAGASEENSAATTQVSGTAHELADTARRLRAAVEAFRL